MTDTATSPAALLAGEPAAGAGAKADIPDYLTVEEIAAKIKSSRAFIYKEIDAGRLECDRFGALVRISPEQFDRYRNRPRQTPKAA
jgi:excisionase family DNA binding protein